jgi:hypothetical protein
MPVGNVIGTRIGGEQFGIGKFAVDGGRFGIFIVVLPCTVGIVAFPADNFRLLVAGGYG